MLASAGFAVLHVPVSQLHPEYQGGEYWVLRACRLGPAPEADTEECAAVTRQAIKELYALF